MQFLGTLSPEYQEELTTLIRKRGGSVRFLREGVCVRPPKLLNHIYTYMDMVRVLTRLTTAYSDLDIIYGTVDMATVYSPVSHEDLWSFFEYTGSGGKEVANLKKYREKYLELVSAPVHSQTGKLDKYYLLKLVSLLFPQHEVEVFLKQWKLPFVLEEQMATSLRKLCRKVEHYDDYNPFVPHVLTQETLVKKTFERDEKKYKLDKRTYVEVHGETVWY
jgi:hypothetical protein